ncbi:LLM class flavin-dependent oxidoreductase [Umezawaea sp. NPDC059074]|uniref:LLM class flavin-dependent oxidoreductase n=1 Tax=Umezawaea sp. NPDC059074 TaxID=3346716 RepID=UPI00369FDA9D
MDVGVGLPNTVVGVTRRELLDWAVRAEELGASSVACVDRLVYPSWDTLTALAAAAAVTERVDLLASVLVAPLRTNTALLAKQVQTVDALSEGRLVLGVGVGRRPDDYERSGVDFHRRGRVLDATLTELAGFAAGEVGPGGTPTRVLVGGQSEATLRRLATHGEGWIAAAGLGGWAGALEFADRVRQAWTRPGKPRLVATVYTAGGPDPLDRAAEYVHAYYGFLGAAKASELAAHVLTDRARLVEARDKLAAAGFDELVLLPTSARLDDLEPLAHLLSTT